MFNWGQQYRTFAYLNVVVVLMCGFYEVLRKRPLNKVNSYLYFLLIPAGFICIHYIAVNEFAFNKEIRSLLLASFLFVGITLLGKTNKEYLERNIYVYLVALILIYITGQAVAIGLFHQPYGTTKNPHYLAMYSAIALIISIFCFIYSSSSQKILLGICILILGAFLLQSSSRPTWIGLILSSILVLFFLQKKSRNLASIIFISVLLFLTLTNVGNFSNRFQELIINIGTEERVVIWQDSWDMQRTSTSQQWLFGHGLNSFKENFKSYSHYHQQQVDFNSPHNFLLELLYISGVIGLTLVATTVTLIYKNLIDGLNNTVRYRKIYLMLLALITSNFIMVAITLPFFTSFNLNIIAIVAGVDIYLKQRAKNE